MMEEHIEFLATLKAKGEKSKSALKAAFKQHFGSDKEFAAAYKGVNQIFSEYFQKSIEKLAPELALHYWDLYAKSYKLQDYRECRAILKDLRDLTGVVHEMQPPQKIEKPTSSVMKLRKKAI
jgi:hypothetical protein